MLLVGDIGGIQSRLGLLPLGHGPTATVAEASFASRDYPGLDETIVQFLHGKVAMVDRAVFAVAGPAPRLQARLGA